RQSATHHSPSQEPKEDNTMTSFIRISDIPPDELHLLPISALRQQIIEDRKRPSPSKGRTDQGNQKGSAPRQTFHAEVTVAGVWQAAAGRFDIADQLQDGPRSSSRLPVDEEDIDDDEFGDEGFDDSEDADVGEEDDWRQTGGRFTRLSRSRSTPAD